MPLALKLPLACWFFAISVQALRKRDARLLKLLIVSTTCVCGVALVGVALTIAARHTAKYDLWLYSADTALGAPSFMLARLLRVGAFYHMLVVVYEAMPMTLLLVYAAHLLRNGTPERVLAAFVLNFGVGYSIYLLLPACGPAYAFPSFPAGTAGVPALHTLNLLAPPNCMPSLHTSTALLACWFCRPWRLAHSAAWLNLILTVLATIATGEHYIVDLVVAAPFTAFVYTASRRRVRPAAAWLGAVLAWCAMLRFGLAWITAAPGGFLCVCVATVAAAWLYSWHLDTVAQTGRVGLSGEPAVASVNQKEYCGMSRAQG